MSSRFCVVNQKNNNNEILITSVEENIFEAGIYDISGREIAKKENNHGNQLTLSVSGFLPGIYLLQINRHERIKILISSK